MAKFLQDKPLHVRRRIAIIATGVIALILIALMFYSYSHPQKVSHDPERRITYAYTMLLEKLQSLFHRK
jgi:hypothetical protein